MRGQALPWRWTSLSSHGYCSCLRCAGATSAWLTRSCAAPRVSLARLSHLVLEGGDSNAFALLQTCCVLATRSVMACCTLAASRVVPWSVLRTLPNRTAIPNCASRSLPSLSCCRHRLQDLASAAGRSPQRAGMLGCPLLAPGIGDPPMNAAVPTHTCSHLRLEVHAKPLPPAADPYPSAPPLLLPAGPSSSGVSPLASGPELPPRPAGPAALRQAALAGTAGITAAPWATWVL